MGRIGVPLMDLSQMSEALAMHTHKDMLSRRFRMLTVSQLNFTPLESTGGQAQIIATINASAEALYISAAKLNITGITIFSSGNTLAEEINLGVTTIDGDVITAGTITADEITGNTLSAIYANLGVITAGSLDAVTITASTITGSTLTTGNTGSNIYIVGDKIRFRRDFTSKGYINVDGTALYYYSSWDIHIFDSPAAGGCSVIPIADDKSFVGNASYAWSDVYAYDFHDECSLYDDLDDLALLKAVKPKKDKNGVIILDKYGHKKMDLATLPPFIRRDPTKEDWDKHNVSVQKYSKLTDKEIAKGPQKPSEPHIFRNMGRYVDLIAGGLKQLDERVQQLESA